jgi:hypothetical protein
VDLKIIIAISLLILGNIMCWFQMNSQFIWVWWRDHPVFTVVLYAIPTGLSFYFAWRYAVEALGSLWAAKMLSFGVGTTIFTALTYFMMSEGLDTKTILCIPLCILIIIIQLS